MNTDPSSRRGTFDDTNSTKRRSVSNASLLKELNETIEQRKQVNLKLHKLDLEYTELKAKHDALVKELESFGKRMSTLTITPAAQAKEIPIITKKIKKLQKQIDNDHEYEDNAQKLADLDMQKLDLEMDIRAKVRELQVEKARLAIHMREAEIKNQQELFETLMQKVEKIRAGRPEEIEEKEAKIEKVEAIEEEKQTEVTYLQKMLQKIEGQMDDEKAKTRKLKDEIKYLFSQLREKQPEMERELRLSVNAKLDAPINTQSRYSGGDKLPPPNLLGNSGGSQLPPPNLLGNTGSGTLLPPPNLLGNSGGSQLPPPNLLGNTSGGSLLPPPNLLGNSSGGSQLPPPNLLGNTGGSQLPPPNLLGNTSGGSLLPPPNLLGNAGGSQLPPPNLLGNSSGGSQLPPPNLLGNSSGKSQLPPPNLLGGGNQLPPPNLLGGGNNSLPPPNLLGGGNSTLPPPNLLSGGKPGGLPPPNLLGGGGSGGLPPPNLLGGGGSGGLPPPNLLGKPGGLPPPNLGGPGGLQPPNLGGPGGLKPPTLGAPNLAAPNNAFLQLQQSQLSSLGGGTKSKPKANPSVPMKAVNWQMVPPKDVKGTVWEQIDDSDVQLDKAFLESTFAQKVVAKTETKKEPEKPQKISFLPPDRTKNVSLVLGKLKMQPKDIAYALMTCDEGILKANVVESLSSILPTEAEVKLVAGHEDQFEMLEAADKFFLEIGTVPGYLPRVMAIKFKHNYKWYMEDFNTKADRLQALIERCRNDPQLTVILKYILAVGNYMNGESARGGAYGFKLDIVEKLMDMKGQDSKQPLLIHIINHAESVEGTDVIDPKTDLTEFTEIGMKVPISQLVIDLNDVKKLAKYVPQAMSKQTELKEDVIKSYLSDFNLQITQIITDADQKLKDLEKNYVELCGFYSENVKDCPSEKLFEKIYKCYNTLIRAKKESIRLKELEAKRKEQEEKKKKTGK